MSTLKELRRKELKPNPSKEYVLSILNQGWNFNKNIEIKQLDSYDDANYYVKFQESTDVESKEYLIKFYNGVESEDFVNDFNNSLLTGFVKLFNHLNNVNNSLLTGFVKLLNHLSNVSENIVKTPTPIKSIQPNCLVDEIFLSSDCSTISNVNCKIAVILFEWIPGVTLNSIGYNGNTLLSVGNTLGLLTNHLSNFDHQSFHRSHSWDLKILSDSRCFLDYVDDEAIRNIILEVHESMNTIDFSSFEYSVILGDCNDANIIVTNDVNDPKLVGLIDFGDAVYTCTIFDLAITIAYGLTSIYGLTNYSQVARRLYSAYVQHKSIPKNELIHMKTFIASRLAMSISIGAYSIYKDPLNDYLKLHALPARRALITLWNIDDESFINSLTDNEQSTD